MAARNPTANMPAQQHADHPRPAPPGAPAANNNPAPAFVAYDRQNHMGPVVRNTEAELDDIISNGLEFLNQARTNNALGIDEELRQLLLNPLPSEAKPLKIVGEVIIPEELYKYFYLLTYRTNKILTTLCIWLDLFTRCDIYISFGAVCAIQERLFRDSKAAFSWVKGKRLAEQSEQVRLYTTGVLASTKMLEVWSKTEYGKTLRRCVEALIEDKVSAEEDNPADKMLSRLSYNQWKGYLGEERGDWLVLINQRFQ